MPATRTKRTSQRPARKPAAKPTGNAARRKKRATPRSTPQAGWAWLRRGTSEPALPGWKELAAGDSAPRPVESKAFLARVSTARFGLLLLLVASLFTAYIGHVHATQELAVALQQAQRENLRLHLKLNRLKGEFDGATGPAVVYERARAMGFEEGIIYGPTIYEIAMR